MFTRLYYYGRVQLGLSDAEFWSFPLGEFLDLWECHKQWLGVAKVVREVSVDDIIPTDI
jgi:hypothetical protein